MKPELEIIYQDQAILVVNKPSGLLAVPGRGSHKRESVVSRAKRALPELPEQPAVHRLDMMTTGLMLLAKTNDALKNLSKQFQYRLVQKRYLAVLDGELSSDSGTIELPFRLDPDNRPHQIYDPVNGKLGITMWKRIGTEQSRTRVEFTPVTGRTHQLRLHAAHPLGLGTPIVGDYLYGSGCDGDKMLLHSSFLLFKHPESARMCSFSSKPPF